jgi:hypothetical protein
VFLVPQLSVGASGGHRQEPAEHLVLPGLKYAETLGKIPITSSLEALEAVVDEAGRRGRVLDKGERGDGFLVLTKALLDDAINVFERISKERG